MSADDLLCTEELDSWLLENVVCPLDRCSLERDGNWLISTVNEQNRYPIAYGIPVMIPVSVNQTAWWAMESRKRAEAIANGEEDSQFYDCSDDEVHPHVRGILESTGGHLYKAIKQTVPEYPIPGIRMSPRHESALLLDCGCNWGRWTFSAARNGFRSVGIDPSLHAVIAARQIRRRLKLPCTFVVGDCRYLPFSDAVFSDVFSYSVVQHFSRADAALAANDFARVGASACCRCPIFSGFDVCFTRQSEVFVRVKTLTSDTTALQN